MAMEKSRESTISLSRHIQQFHWESVFNPEVEMHLAPYANIWAWQSLLYTFYTCPLFTYLKILLLSSNINIFKALSFFCLPIPLRNTSERSFLTRWSQFLLVLCKNDSGVTPGTLKVWYIIEGCCSSCSLMLWCFLIGYPGALNDNSES